MSLWLVVSNFDSSDSTSSCTVWKPMLRKCKEHPWDIARVTHCAGRRVKYWNSYQSAFMKNRILEPTTTCCALHTTDRAEATIMYIYSCLCVPDDEPKLKSYYPSVLKKSISGEKRSRATSSNHRPEVSEVVGNRNARVSAVFSLKIQSTHIP